MDRQIDCGRVRELLAEGAQIIEVLPRSDWEELHLPGALSIPLAQLDGERAAELDRERPVITYCWDRLCDLSARAARQLANLGFEEVYDYAASKVDWMARGLPVEGARAGEKRALDYALAGEVTCSVGDAAGDVLERVRDSPYGFAVVTADDGTVLGLLDGEALQAGPSVRAGEAMHLGPATHRANEAVDKLLERLERRELTVAVLTDPDGRLLGLVPRDRLAGA